MSSIMVKELGQLRDMILSVSVTVQASQEASPFSHKVWRSTSPTCDIDVLKWLQTNNMKIYNGTIYP